MSIEAFWEFVLTQAEPWHRRHLNRLILEWEDYDGAYFENKLTAPIILLAEPSTPRALGQCALISSYGARSEIRIRPSLLAGTHPHIDAAAPREGRARFADDVLLHEQIHQWHQEITGINEPAYHGHGPAFRGTCNRIGQALGLPRVRTCKRRGPDADLPSCSHWPHNVRPVDYYQGAYLGVPASRDNLAEEIARLVNRYGLKHVTDEVTRMALLRSACVG